ncbi:hypothetical protein RI367_000063 [Sorochytrium milnesiophthora]
MTSGDASSLTGGGLTAASAQSGTVSVVIMSCLVTVAALFVRRYAHATDRDPLATLVSIVGLSVTLAACTIIPADIFLVSATNDHRAGLRYSWASDALVAKLVHTLQVAYYVVLGVLAFLSFVAVPFAYFFYEEYDEGISLKERVAKAVKFTLATMTLGIILLVVGALIQPSDGSKHIDFDYFKHVLSDSGAEKSILFVLSIIMSFGMVVFVVYTTTGLMLLPVSMLKSVKSYDRDVADVSAQLASVSARIAQIREKYNANDRMTTRDRAELERLENQQSVMMLRLDVIQQSTRGYFRRCTAWFRPLKVLLGLLMLATSFTVLFSILIVSVTQRPPCDNCPLLTMPIHVPYNPLNGLLIALANYYPLDHILLSLVIVYLLFATIHGVTRIGIRFLWVHMYKIKARRTRPQGLLLVSVMCMGALLAIAWEVGAVVGSQYATWGSQTYCNYTVTDTDGKLRRDCHDQPALVLPCDISAPIDICASSALSSILTQMAIFTPIFPTIFYYTQFVILVVAALSLLYAVFSKRQGRADHIGVDDDDDDLDIDRHQARPAAASRTSIGSDAARPPRSSSADVESGRGSGSSSFFDRFRRHEASSSLGSSASTHGKQRSPLGSGDDVSADNASQPLLQQPQSHQRGATSPSPNRALFALPALALCTLAQAAPVLHPEQVHMQSALHPEQVHVGQTTTKGKTDDSDTICDADGGDCYPRAFVATRTFQTVRPGQELPPGLHIRINMTTGKKEAKLMDTAAAEGDANLPAVVESPAAAAAPQGKDDPDYGTAPRRVWKEPATFGQLHSAIDELLDVADAREDTLMKLEDLVHEAELAAELTHYRGGQAFRQLVRLGCDELHNAKAPNNPAMQQYVSTHQPDISSTLVRIAGDGKAADTTRKLALYALSAYLRGAKEQMQQFLTTGRDNAVSLEQLVPLLQQSATPAIVRAHVVQLVADLVREGGEFKLALHASDWAVWGRLLSDEAQQRQKIDMDLMGALRECLQPGRWRLDQTTRQALIRQRQETRQRADDFTQDEERAVDEVLGLTVATTD